MIRKYILNGFMVCLVCTATPLQSYQALFASLKYYFNKPTQNALVVTTAIAGVSIIATFACAWSWWKSHWKTAAEHEQEAALASEQENSELRKSNKELKALNARPKNILIARLIRANRNLQAQLARKNAARAEERRRLKAMKLVIAECESEYSRRLSPSPGEKEPDIASPTSAGSELLAPPAQS